MSYNIADTDFKMKNKIQIALSLEECTFLVDYFIQTRKFIILGNKEDTEISNRIYNKIKDSKYLESEDFR